MKTKFLFKCPYCSFEGTAKYFAKVKTKTNIRWYTVASSYYETSCPACGKELEFANKTVAASLAILVMVCSSVARLYVPAGYVWLWRVVAPISFVLVWFLVVKKLVKLVARNA